MKRFRTKLKIWIPLSLVILISGLVLARIYQPVPGNLTPEVTIHASEASKHPEVVAEVCGQVASASIVRNINGNPTFINLEKAYPDQLFTAVIWGEHRGAWTVPPEELYQDKPVCITGTIHLHEEVPQIVVTSPEQIHIQQR